MLKATSPNSRAKQLPSLQVRLAAAQRDLQALKAAWQQAGHSWYVGHDWGKRSDTSTLDQSWVGGLCSAAAAGSHLALLQWVHKQGCSLDRSTCSSAAGGGHLAVLQWLRQIGCSWDKETCAKAAEGGHLALLEWARQSGCSWNKKGAQAQPTKAIWQCCSGRDRMAAAGIG